MLDDFKIADQLVQKYQDDSLSIFCRASKSQSSRFIHEKAIGNKTTHSSCIDIALWSKGRRGNIRLSGLDEKQALRHFDNFRIYVRENGIPADYEALSNSAPEGDINSWRHNFGKQKSCQDIFQELKFPGKIRADINVTATKTRTVFLASSGVKKSFEYGETDIVAHIPFGEKPISQISFVLKAQSRASLFPNIEYEDLERELLPGGISFQCPADVPVKLSPWAFAELVEFFLGTLSGLRGYMRNKREVSPYDAYLEKIPLHIEENPIAVASTGSFPYSQHGFNRSHRPILKNGRIAKPLLQFEEAIQLGYRYEGFDGEFSNIAVSGNDNLRLSCKPLDENEYHSIVEIVILSADPISGNFVARASGLKCSTKTQNSRLFQFGIRANIFEFLSRITFLEEDVNLLSNIKTPSAWVSHIG